MTSLYRDILKKSWQITKKYFYLWPLGLFVSFLGNGGEYQILINQIKRTQFQRLARYKDLEKELLASEENNVYFDIDLDFFTLNNPLQIGGGSKNYTYLTEKTIKEMLNPDNPLMQWVFQRLQGITIATEMKA